MERFIPVENFRKKSNSFQVLPFSRFDRNDQNFLYHSGSAQVPSFLLRRKVKNGGHFPGGLHVPLFGNIFKSSTICQKSFTEIS